MAYKIVVSAKARRQLVNAADYYHDISPVITVKFLSAIQEAYNKVSLNPYFQVRYRKGNTYKRLSLFIIFQH